MSRLARCEVIDPNEVTVVHVINRTVRRCFLFGDDPVSGKNFDHRKIWVEELLEHFAAHFGIDLLCYAILSNHYHLILRSRPDVVESWDDAEVARRWLMICPGRRDGWRLAAPTDSEINAIRNCPIKLAEIRTRLSSISWWMRLLNQRVAQRANKEDQESGRFWQDRYRAIRLIDEQSLLACAAYVDLNPIRAAIADTVEKCDHTSIQRRIRSRLDKRRGQKGDAFLARLTLDEANRSNGASESQAGRRCSDTGFLPISLDDYLQLLDWTARQIVPGKRGVTPRETPPVLCRLGLGPKNWQTLVTHFTASFYYVAGRNDRVASLRSYHSMRRFYIRRSCQQLLAA
ncbi:MAG: transposase [Planctomycetota bacterium]